MTSAWVGIRGQGVTCAPPADSRAVTLRRASTHGHFQRVGLQRADQRSRLACLLPALQSMHWPTPAGQIALATRTPILRPRPRAACRSIEPAMRTMGRESATRSARSAAVLPAAIWVMPSVARAMDAGGQASLVQQHMNPQPRHRGRPGCTDREALAPREWRQGGGISLPPGRSRRRRQAAPPCPALPGLGAAVRARPWPAAFGLREVRAECHRWLREIADGPTRGGRTPRGAASIAPVLRPGSGASASWRCRRRASHA